METLILKELDSLRAQFGDRCIGRGEFFAALEAGDRRHMSADLQRCFEMADVECTGTTTWAELTHCLVHVLRVDGGRDSVAVRHGYNNAAATPLTPPEVLSMQDARHCPGLGLLVPYTYPRAGAAVVDTARCESLEGFHLSAVVATDNFRRTLSAAYLRRHELLVVATEGVQVRFYHLSSVRSTRDTDAGHVACPDSVGRAQARVGSIDPDTAALREARSKVARGGGAAAAAAPPPPGSAPRRSWNSERSYVLRAVVATPCTHCALAANEAGTVLASGDRDGGVHVWTLPTLARHWEAVEATTFVGGSSARTVAKHEEQISALVFLDASTLAAASTDSRISLVNLDTGAVTVAVAGRGRSVDMSLRGEAAREKRGGGGGGEAVNHSYVSCLSYCEAQRVLVAGGWEGLVQVYALHEGSKPTSLRDMADPHRTSIVSVVTPPAAAAAVTADACGMVKVWDLSRNCCVQSFVLAASGRPSCALHGVWALTDTCRSDPSLLAVWAGRAAVVPPSFTTSRQLAHEDDVVKGVEVMACTGLILTHTAREVCVWHAFTGSLVTTHRGGMLLRQQQGSEAAEEIVGVASSGTHELWYAMATSKAAVKTVHVFHGLVLKTVGVGGVPVSVFYDASRAWLIVGCANGWCHVFQNVRGSPVLSPLTSFSAGPREAAWNLGDDECVLYYNRRCVVLTNLTMSNKQTRVVAFSEQATQQDIVAAVKLGPSPLVAVADSANQLSFWGVAWGAAPRVPLVDVRLSEPGTAHVSPHERITHLAFHKGQKTLYLGTSGGVVLTLACKEFISATLGDNPAAKTQRCLFAKLALGPEASLGAAGGPITHLAFVPHSGLVLAAQGRQVLVLSDTLAQLALLSQVTTDGYDFPLALHATVPRWWGSAGARRDAIHVRTPPVPGQPSVEGYLYTLPSRRATMEALLKKAMVGSDVCKLFRLQQRGRDSGGGGRGGVPSPTAAAAAATTLTPFRADLPQKKSPSFAVAEAFSCGAGGRQTASATVDAAACFLSPTPPGGDAGADPAQTRPRPRVSLVPGGVALPVAFRDAPAASAARVSPPPPTRQRRRRRLQQTHQKQRRGSARGLTAQHTHAQCVGVSFAVGEDVGVEGQQTIVAPPRPQPPPPVAAGDVAAEAQNGVVRTGKPLCEVAGKAEGLGWRGPGRCSSKQKRWFQEWHSRGPQRPPTRVAEERVQAPAGVAPGSQPGWIEHTADHLVSIPDDVRKHPQRAWDAGGAVRYLSVPLSWSVQR